MANMATVHQMSVLTNSCVRSPINSQTGLYYANDERAKGDASMTWADKRTYHDSDQENKDFIPNQSTRSINFDTTHFETMHEDLNNLTDDAFYAKLLKLKEDHKKTLEFCEQLYSEKIETQRRIRSRSPSPVAVGRQNYTNPMSVNGDVNRSLDYLQSSIRNARDEVRDMNSSSSKPPLPKKSPGTPQIRPSSASGRRSRQARASQEISSSSEDDFSRRRRHDSPQRSLEMENMHNDSRLSSLSRIEDMWEQFSVDDYAPRQRKTRKRSNSLSRLSDSSFKNKELDADVNGKWRHRITIPKPFSMTLRDSLKSPKKTKAMIELEEKRQEEKLREDEECQKKFKAKPVPAHIYMPLYDEITEKEEARRRYNRQMSADLIKSQQKPFKFSTREEEKKKSISSKTSILKAMDTEMKKEFKAKPFPEKIFSYSAQDKMQEEEEYRKIRVQMRAEELLRSAALPPTMAARGKAYTDGKSRQKLHAERAKKSGITIEHKFKPKVNDDIPDFDELHRKFLNELGQRKGEKEATVCKPFNLRTSRIPSTKHKIYEDILRDEEMLHENRWPFQNRRTNRYGQESGEFSNGLLTGMSKNLSTSLDSIPAKMTAAAELRASANKKKMQQQVEAEIQELEAERKKRLKEKELQKTISEKALANDQTEDLKKQQAQKLREYRENERSREEEYRRYLNEVNTRVQQRPLLFERTVQENARRQAEKKYQETLQRAGISEDFIESRGSDGPASTVPSARYSEHSARSQTSVRSYSKSLGTGKYTDDFNESKHTEDEGSDIDEDVVDS